MPSNTPFLIRGGVAGSDAGVPAALAAGTPMLAAQAALTEVFRKSRRDDFCMMSPRKREGARSQNAECRMQNAECRMQNAECRMQNAECRMYLFHAALKEFDGPMPKNLSRDLSHSDF